MFLIFLYLPTHRIKAVEKSKVYYTTNYQQNTAVTVTDYFVTKATTVMVANYYLTLDHTPPFQPPIGQTHTSKKLMDTYTTEYKEKNRIKMVTKRNTTNAMETVDALDKPAMSFCKHGQCYPQILRHTMFFFLTKSPDRIFKFFNKTIM